MIRNKKGSKLVVIMSFMHHIFFSQMVMVATVN